MSTPIITARRNLAQRIANLLRKAGGDEFKLTPWQLGQVREAIEQLEGGRFAEGERAMSEAERPDLYEPDGYVANEPIEPSAFGRPTGSRGCSCIATASAGNLPVRCHLKTPAGPPQWRSAPRHDGQSSAPGCRRRTNPFSCPRRTLAPTHRDTDYGLRNG